MNQRILVWDFPTRLFHWLLVASFAGAYVTAESELLRDIHLICGYLLLGLIGFRLIWGFIGSRHARFGDFVRGPAKIREYLQSLWQGRPQHYAGHNPAGALAIVLLIALGIAVGVTGWLNFDEIDGETFKELHEGLANAMLALVAIHVLGVIVSSWLHRENLIGAMILGYKNGAAQDGIPRAYGIVAILLFAAALGFGWGLSQGMLPALYDPGAVATEKPAGSHQGKHRHHDDG